MSLLAGLWLQAAEHAAFSIPCVSFFRSIFRKLAFGSNMLQMLQLTLRHDESLAMVPTACSHRPADRRYRKACNNRSADRRELKVCSNRSANRRKLEKGEFDFNKTLFIAMGSFQKLRNEKAAKAKCRTIGFTPTAKEETDENAELHQSITIEEMTAFGMKEEMAGRFSLIMNFRRIPETVMESLAQKKAEEVGQELNIKISLSKKVLADMCGKAYGPCGVRAPINAIRQLCYETLAYETMDTHHPANKKLKLYIKSLNEVQVIREDAPAVIG